MWLFSASSLFIFSASSLFTMLNCLCKTCYCFKISNSCMSVLTIWTVKDMFNFYSVTLPLLLFLRGGREFVETNKICYSFLILIQLSYIQFSQLLSSFVLVLPSLLACADTDFQMTEDAIPWISAISHKCPEMTIYR